MRVLESNELVQVEGASFKPVPQESNIERNARIAVQTCGAGKVKEVTETSFTCK